ncbi:LysM peptidoglycan-binding domain-containing protein [Bacillus mangrovi]|uniref:LysM peptidoglycan-binding domain-containing protein n=1 Tax=Metabacillus mangrovi TaxID=1491830 RepID=A0A7X2V4I4_9BACI|nr:cell wall hydrolase [Metabacillus mangrovi]MTH53161.1 LysM peptidoglycan-binding domain-containing protein [Metabacillus mangrovi]
MKQKVNAIFTAACGLFILYAAEAAAQEKHKVKPGETLKDISFAYIVTIEDLEKWNEMSRNAAVEGEVLQIPDRRAAEAKGAEEGISVSKEEKELLAKLVHAEAKGEPHEGKVAVASVVLNRVESSQFPDTVKDVIYEKNAFSPVANGSIHKPANEESKQAAEEALRTKTVDYLYFFNPETAESEWIKKLKVEEKIGNHAFAG